MVGPTVDEVVVKNRLRRWPKEAGNKYSTSRPRPGRG
jgi:hypothetical protein